MLLIILNQFLTCHLLSIHRENGATDDDDDKLISFDTSNVEDNDEQEERAEVGNEAILDMGAKSAIDVEEDLLGIFDKPMERGTSAAAMYGDFESSDNSKQAGGKSF